MFNFEVVNAGSDDVSTTVSKLVSDDVTYNMVIVSAGLKTKHQKSVTVNAMATADNFCRFGGFVMVNGKACVVAGEAELKQK